MGFAVPDDVSIVGWDDSLISQVVHPPLTAITRDNVDYGSRAIHHLLDVIDGRTTADLETPAGELTPRGSTGPARRGTPANA
jgi:DNA-binding LacI/PurR family transcriptional regulator